MRSYHEINEFEQELVAGGAIVAKFWLSVTLAEQLRRFRAREQTPYKQHKITPDDWRNREKWPQYKEAVNEMVVRTSTKHAGWTLVEGNDKPYARIKVLRTICDTLTEALKGEPITTAGYLPCGEKRIEEPKPTKSGNGNGRS